MSGIPQYRRLYELLRKHILDGVYKEGDLLPSENELCKFHRMTRPTVRKALDNLVKDGYIKKQQGKGSIVHQLPKGIGILSVGGTTSALGKKNLQTKIIVKPTISKWPENFMFQLSEEEIETGCIHLERLRLFNGKPIFYDINYLPNINLPRFTSRKLENKSLFDILRSNYKIDIIGGEQKLRAIPARGNVCEYLNVKENQPVLHLDRKIDTSRVGFYVYSSIYCDTSENFIYGVF
jgi:DNA-binding GntR family transcriptional regulator